MTPWGYVKNSQTQKEKKRQDKKGSRTGLYTCLLLFTLAINFSSFLFSASTPHVIFSKAKKLTYLAQNAHILTPFFKTESIVHIVRHVYPHLRPLTILTTSLTGLTSFFSILLIMLVYTVPLGSFILN